MRKYSLSLLVVLLVFALGLGAVACGSGSSGKAPQELLTAAVDTGKSATVGSGTYEIDLTVKADDSSGDAGMAQAFLSQPIKITGTFAGQEDPALAELSASLDLMGTSMAAGIRAIDNNAWVNVLGQWYEVPADATQQTTASGSADTMKALRDAMDEQGINPVIWCKDLKVVGEEQLSDTTVTHLKGTVDVQKMVADLVTLMQNPKLQAILASESAATGTSTEVTLPDATAIEQLQTTVQQMLKDATLEFWVASGDSSMRKLVLNANIVVPADQASSGVSGATVVFTINLDAPNTAVAVKAPEGAKPMSELQTDIQSNPLLSGLSGLLGSGGLTQ